MQIPYLIELLSQAIFVIVEVLLMELMWSVFRDLTPIYLKISTGQQITDDEQQTAIDHFENIARLWNGIMLMASCYLTYPFAIINKYVLSKLTDRPFTWLSTYTADLLTLACFLYTFGWHVVWDNI